VEKAISLVVLGIPMDLEGELGGVSERTKRIHQLRRKIDRINEEIRTLLESQEPSPSEGAGGTCCAGSLQAVACVGCRHDEITRFMEEDLEMNQFLCGISVRGGLILNEERGTKAWWATTLRLTSLLDLARCTRTVQNIYDYLEEITDIQLLGKLHDLATGQDPDASRSGGEGRRANEKGIRMGLIAEKGSGGHSLTPKGWELYVTLAHLVHNHVVKLEPERSQLISEALADKLGWIHGTIDNAKPYQMSMNQKMDLLRRSGVLSDLLGRGLTEDQVREFLYDNWHIEHNASKGSKAG